MDYTTIRLEKVDSIATIVLNRPDSLNAMNLVMRQEFGNVVFELGQDDSVRVVVITGAGRAFCAGGDAKVQSTALDEVDLLTRAENIRIMNKAIMGIRKMQKPVIAAINGVAVGAGCNIALVCDIRIASVDAKFGMGFLKTGLHPDTGATYFLPRLIGTARACEMMFTGKIIDAREAERIGLVNRVVEASELADTVNELATRIAKAPPVPLVMTKNLIYDALNMDLETILEYETLGQVLCLTTKDHREGITAFIEKREAKFIGR
jgi:2-(1,2-epoxy-1,2-dihydrophenyl)acetyl-CoA isomerase